MKQITLSNGLRCLFFFKPVHSITINMYIKVGSRDEHKNSIGCSHLLEHILFNGSKKYKTHHDIFSKLELLGDYNASTSKNTTHFFMTIPNETQQCKEALELLSDMLFFSSLKRLEKEKKVVLEEINFDKLNYDKQIIQGLFKTLFQNHPLSKKIIGNKKNVSSITPQTIKRFYEKYYVPSNMYLVICGNYPKNIEKIVSKIFKKVKKSTFTNPIPTHAIRIQTKPRINVIEKQLPQVFLTLGFPSCNFYNITERLKLIIISKALAGGLQSKLSLYLREKLGLIYGIYAHNEHYQDNGVFYIHSQLDLDNLLNKNFLKFMLKKLEKIKKKGLTNKEFNLFRDMCLTDTKLSQNDLLSLSDHWGYQLLYQQKPLHTVQSLITKINKITVKEINDLLGKLFDFSKMNLCLIGNVKKKDIINYLHDNI